MTPPFRTRGAAAQHRIETIYALVRAIPAGCVATYGAIARRAGLRSARLVGAALSGLPAEHAVPWHRVVNARGAISLTGADGARQRALLEAEGVSFDAAGRVDLEVFSWHDDAPLR
jgi:methylated-DNA-protein-cysteine methyltransferase related protein